MRKIKQRHSGTTYLVVAFSIWMAVSAGFVIADLEATRDGRSERIAAALAETE